MCDACPMPWMPELFSTPVVQRVLDERRQERLVALPFFDGLLAGEPDALVGSFAGEPRLCDPVTAQGWITEPVTVRGDDRWLPRELPVQVAKLVTDTRAEASAQSPAP